jgi:hypothetical protein
MHDCYREANHVLSKQGHSGKLLYIRSPRGANELLIDFFLFYLFLINILEMIQEFFFLFLFKEVTPYALTRLMGLARTHALY